MNIGLIILAVLTCLGLGVDLAKHGEPKNTKHNFLVSLIAAGIMWYIYHIAGLY